MAKSKYIPERVERILEAVALDGGDRAGWEAGEITEATFYRWQKEHREFRESLARAKEDYRRTCQPRLKLQARRALADYLFEGNIVKREKSGESVKIVEDADGNVKLVEKTTYSDRYTDRMPPPQWAIDRVLGKATDELAAVNILIQAGWLPAEILTIAGEGMENLRQLIQQAFQKQILPKPEE